MVENIFTNTFWRGRFFRYAPLACFAAIILLASTTQASMSNTSRFIGPLLEFLFPDTDKTDLINYHGYIRKFAHLAEYALLGFFASRAFWYSSKKVLKDNWCLAAILTVFFVALIDEVNQSFNPTRTGSFYDVLLDLIGGAIMIASLLVYKKYRND